MPLDSRGLRTRELHASTATISLDGTYSAFMFSSSCHNMNSFQEKNMFRASWHVLISGSLLFPRSDSAVVMGLTVNVRFALVRQRYILTRGVNLHSPRKIDLCALVETKPGVFSTLTRERSNQNQDRASCNSMILRSTLPGVTFTTPTMLREVIQHGVIVLVVLCSCFLSGRAFIEN
jgi:hypothetical protein